MVQVHAYKWEEGSLSIWDSLGQGVQNWSIICVRVYVFYGHSYYKILIVCNLILFIMVSGLNKLELQSASTI